MVEAINRLLPTRRIVQLKINQEKQNVLYLYSFEDGIIKQDTQGPTDTDYLAVEDGTLSVIRLSVFEPVDSNGEPAYVVAEELLPDGARVLVDQAEVVSTHGHEWHE